MMSTLGLELTGFLNPDLTWKTVSKGSRSGTRRTRKRGAISLGVGMGLAEKSARTVEDVTASESEKLGVDVLGRRFREKVEHIPIKKRRFALRSPSPPSPLTPSPHLEASGQHVDFKPAPGQNIGSNSVQSRRLLKSDCFTKSTVASIDDEKSSEEINDLEDFSGIEILAAAACSDSLGNDVTEKNEGNPLVEESTKERVESSASAMPLEEATASLETACCSPKDSVTEGKTEGSSFQVDSFAVLDESPGDKDNTTAERSIPLPDDRLLWDLNVSMDAWPCDGGNVDSQKDAVDNISVTSEVLQSKPSHTGNLDSEKDAMDNISVVSEELQNEEPQDIKYDTMKKVVSSDVDVENMMTSDLRPIPVGTDDLSREKQEFEGCSGSSENRTENVPVPLVDAENFLMSAIIDTNASVEAVNVEFEGCSGFSKNRTENVLVPLVDAENFLMSAIIDTNASVEAVNTDQCLSNPPFPGSDKSMWVSEEDRETSLSTHNIKLSMGGCISEAEVGKTVCVEGVQVEESDVDSPCIPVLGTVANGTQNTSVNIDEKDLDSDFGSDDVKIFAQDMDNPQPLKSGEVGNANGAEELDICHFSPKSEDMSISDDYVMEAMELTDGASSASIAQVGSVTHVGCEVSLLESSRNVDATSGADELSTHEACRNYVNGPTSYLDKANLNDPPKESYDSAVSQDKVLTVGMGNHSELQAGYDSQFEDGELRESDGQCWEEAEQVDYDTEFDEERSFGLEAESGEQNLKVERGLSPDVSGNSKYCGTGEALRENSVNLKMRIVEVPDGETKRSDCLDGSNVRDNDLSKVTKRELHSRVEGSLSSDVAQRSRSDNFDASYPRAEREADFDKFMGRDRSASHMHGRSPGGGHFFNPSASYWDSKRQHAPIYHGPYNLGRTRPKSVVESRRFLMATDQASSEAVGVARPDNRIKRQFMGPSNGAYRPLLRRSPVERYDSYGMRTRMPTVRDASPDRTRFRRYPQGINRGIKDEYLRHISDGGTEYFSRMPHRVGRRERSISPHCGRPNYAVPYKRTRSRSRSHSPIGWLLQRDHNEGSRRRSRSPDFRSDARIERVRLPFTKHFAAGYGEEFISPPPRNRLSPQRNFRVLEDRNSGLDHFRGRKSPLRMFRQGQRFDQVRPIRRLNSDDYLRPMSRPRRFPDMTTGSKGCKYEGSDDDKHGSSRYEIHQVRRYDTDGAVRRIRYNAEDSYVANNSLTATSAVWDLI